MLRSCGRTPRTIRVEFVFVFRTDSSEDVDTFAIRVTAGARRWLDFCITGESGMLNRSSESSDNGGRVRLRGGASEGSSSTRGRIEPATEVAEDASDRRLPLVKPLDTAKGSGPDAWPALPYVRL